MQQEDAADALRCQVEAYKNEAELVRHEHKEELDAKDAEMNIMRKTMQNVQQVGGGGGGGVPPPPPQQWVAGQSRHRGGRRG